MAKILKNQTSSAINLDIGLTVPASGQLTLNPTDFDDAADSNDLVEFIGSGDIVVNDGSFDLDKADAIRLIQGGFTNRVQLDDDLLTGSASSERIKVDIVGSLSTTDGQVLVSSNDTTPGFLEDKVNSSDPNLVRTIANEGGNEVVNFAVDPTQINTTDLNNDAGFITSGQAPVQPGDIADFETSTQLDARDTANRDRANHTGTQLASTISDFASAVQAAETVTSLSVNANILTYTDEDGNQTNIDLSVYLDDTNLARVVSGTLDSNTGIITFTRDDSTTFTVDASALLDDQNASEVPFTPTGNTTSTDVQAAIVELQSEIDLNTPKVSADGSIDTHSDVDVTTTPPNAGDVLAWDGSNFVPDSTDNGFTVFSIWAEENGGLNANSRQWSFGNGATGNINIVLPIEAELFAVSFDNENGTGTVTLEVLQDDIQVFETRQFTNKDFEILSSPITFTAGQCVGFRTGEDNGNFTDARVAAWFRIRTSQLAGSVLNDLLDVTVTSPATGQGIVWNGSVFVNQDIVLPSELATVATTGNYSDLNGLPTLGTAADNAETDFATAAQGLLADSAVQPGDNVSDLTNDAGYVTAGQAAAAAPVQTVNGQTGTVVLAAADVGAATAAQGALADSAVQPGDNISTLTNDSSFITGAQVPAFETNTTLSTIGNTLRYTNEDGTNFDIDLSVYLDDTNLARIVSGSLDSATGIVTFTRDDSTTFTVDFSDLIDQFETRTITQNGHGFTIVNNVPLPAYVNTSGQVVLAQADNLDTLSVFLITEIIDANTIRVQQSGFLNATGHGLNVGEYYFLSNTTPGGITNVEPQATINDVVLFVVDANTLLLTDNRPEDKNSIEKFLIKVRNTDTTTNLNTTNVVVPITGTTAINENNFYTVSGNGIQVPQTRTYDISVSLHVTASSTRTNQRVRLAVNGVQTGDISASGYIRNGSGHNESSYFLKETLLLNANDVVTIVTNPEAGGGTVTMALAGSSSLTIEAR